MKFSFVTHMSIPISWVEDLDIKIINLRYPELAFSTDGSKFAIVINGNRVSVWDIQSKVPLKTFMEFPKPDPDDPPVQYLQFSSGNSEKEVLVFIGVCVLCCLTQEWAPQWS
jgi:WD40 repeat protein